MNGELMKTIIVATLLTLLSTQAFAQSQLSCKTEGPFSVYIAAALQADITSETELSNVSLVAVRKSGYTKSGFENEVLASKSVVNLNNGQTENLHKGWGDLILKIEGLDKRNVKASLYYSEVDGDYFYESTTKMVCEISQ